MAAAPPLTIQLPPLQELSCEMCGTNYEDRGDDVPFCGYGCATGTGGAPPVAQPTWGWALRVLPPPPAETTATAPAETTTEANTEPCTRDSQEDECCNNYDDAEYEEPPGRICPVCGDRFEGNEWFGVCSRRCSRER